MSETHDVLHGVVPDNMDLTKGGVKYDGEKNRWDLFPYDVLDEVAGVLTDGAKKYRDRNWEVGMRWGRPFAATHRHTSAWNQRDPRHVIVRDGITLDRESGRPALAHAICELMFLLAYELRGVGEDDRPEPRSPAPPTDFLRHMTATELAAYVESIAPQFEGVDLDAIVKSKEVPPPAEAKLPLHHCYDGPSESC